MTRRLDDPRVYILSDDEVLAAQSDIGDAWQHAWQDEHGRRLLPFRVPPEGVETMSAHDALAYKNGVDAQRTPPPQQDGA